MLTIFLTFLFIVPVIVPPSFRYRSIIVPVIRSIGATIGAKFVFIGATIGAIGVILVTLLVTTSNLMVTFSMTQCFFYDISMTLISFSMTSHLYIEISA